MKADRLPRRRLPPAPVAPVRPTEVRIHGQAVRDDYAWLKAENWREVLKDPAALADDIRAHLERENAYAAAALADTEELRERLVAEMRGRIKEDDSTVPEPDGPVRLLHPLPRGRAAPPGLPPAAREGGPEEDPSRRRQGGRGFSVLRPRATPNISPDHRLLAWSADSKGSEYFTVRIRDLATGRISPTTIPAHRRRGRLGCGLPAFYYVELDRNHRPARVRRHRLGTPPRTTS